MRSEEQQNSKEDDRNEHTSEDKKRSKLVRLEAGGIPECRVSPPDDCRLWVRLNSAWDILSLAII